MDEDGHRIEIIHCGPPILVKKTAFCQHLPYIFRKTMTQEICKSAFRKSVIFPWNSQNIGFSRLTELRPNPDVARPTQCDFTRV